MSAKNSVKSAGIGILVASQIVLALGYAE
jgi:hypothetical protein